MFTRVLNPSEFIGVKDRGIGREKMNNVLTLRQPSPLNPEPLDLWTCVSVVNLSDRLANQAQSFFLGSQQSCSSSH